MSRVLGCAASAPPSGTGAKLRVVQLEESVQFMLSRQKALVRPQHLMLMGDFNCCGTNDKKGLPMKDAQFADAWVHAHGGEGEYEKKHPGWYVACCLWTRRFDGVSILFLMIRTMPENEYFPAWRPDRLYYAFDYDYSDKDKTEKEKLESTGSLDSDDDDQNDETVQDDVESNAEDDNSAGGAQSGQKGRWMLKSIKRVGMEPIQIALNVEVDDEAKENTGAVKASVKMNVNIKTLKVDVDVEMFPTVQTPSDHYGLIAEFVCSDTSMEELQEIVKERTLETSSLFM